MVRAGRALVLCVDDEPNVLEGLALHLRRHYEVLTAPGGQAGLDLIAKQGTPAVIISDMRMPGMMGNTFLAKAREAAPDATRILLTGQADLDSAISAVNDGQVFRFLTKPCPPPALLAAVEAGAEQHRLVTVERDLLERTLQGTVKTLSDILSLTSPLQFGRAHRIRDIVSELAQALELPSRWQVEVAAMLSQLGAVSLPPLVAQKVFHGRTLSPDEKRMVERAAGLTGQLLANIPRMEPVRRILTVAMGSSPIGELPDEPDGAIIASGARILRAAVDWDRLESRGLSFDKVVEEMNTRAHRHDPAILEFLIDLRRDPNRRGEPRELTIGQLRAGMVLDEDITIDEHTLLAAKGYTITESFLSRLEHVPMEMRQKTYHVLVQG